MVVSAKSCNSRNALHIRMTATYTLNSVSPSNALISE